MPEISLPFKADSGEVEYRGLSREHLDVLCDLADGPAPGQLGPHPLPYLTPVNAILKGLSQEMEGGGFYISIESTFKGEEPLMIKFKYY